MKLSGSYQIKLEKQKVWEALNDPEILQKAIPGCESFTKNSDTEFTATATNKIGPFNASFTGDIELKEINAPHSYVIEGSGNSPVGFASGSATVKLEEKDGGTIIKDNLTYAIPMGIIGRIVHFLYIRHDINGIFKYRHKILDKIFSEIKKQSGKSL